MLYSAIYVVTRWNYGSEDKSRTDTLQKLKTTQKSKQHKTQQNKTSRV